MENNLSNELKQARGYWGETSVPLINVTLTNDYLQKAMRVSPTEAFAELIWNALDADATKVKVSFWRNELGRIEDIQIQDNGHGILYDTIRETFGNLGNSIKLRKNRTPSGRGYHGRLGSGRYKALSLGALVLWKSVYTDPTGNNREFIIKCNKNEATTFDISDEATLIEQPTGVLVSIEGLDDRTSAVMS